MKTTDLRLALLLLGLALPACAAGGDTSPTAAPGTTATVDDPVPGDERWFDDEESDRIFREHWKDGVAKAKADVALGIGHIYFMGLPAMDRDHIDEDTGLPTSSVGCVISPETAGEVEGYNAVMHRAVAAGLLEGARLGHKRYTAESLAALERDDPGTTMTGDTMPLVAPGGRWRIRVGPYRYSSDGPDDEPTPYVFVTDRETGVETPLQYIGALRARIWFAHDGTTLVIRDDEYDRFVTFDLPQLQIMQALAVDLEGDE